METNDLVVRSMSHCFLCLNRIPPTPTKAPSPHKNSYYGSHLQSSVSSLHSLSRCLKMDLGKVFNENELIPQPLLDKVRKSKLKGELCDECALLNDKFSEQYLNLAKIKMEMLSSLRVIQDRMLTEINKTGELRKFAESATDSVDGWMGKLDILEVLRSEAIQKCSNKLNASDTPRVKVHNLTMQQVGIKKQKFKSNFSMETEEHNTTLEEVPDPEIKSSNVDAESAEQMRDQDNEDSYLGYHSDSWESSYGNHGTNANAPVANEGAEDIAYVNVEDGTPGLNRQAGFGKANEPKARTQITADFKSPSIFVIPPGPRKQNTPEISLNPEAGKYKCSLCPSEFKHKGHANDHHKSVHLGVKFECKICGTQYTRRSSYNLHHRITHMGVRIQCLGCNKIFKLKSQLKTHQMKHGCMKTVPKTEAS